MKPLLDTSVLLAGRVGTHPKHASASPWLKKVRRREVQGVIAAHSIAEAFAVLSSLPVSPRITPSTAWTLLERSVLARCQAVSLSASNIQQVVRKISRQGLAGGIVYDALIAEAASKAHAECIVTLKPADSQRVADATEIREP